jgi:signal transduction histidine kinase
MRELQRRLDLIILVHLWALVPLAVLWFVVPTWRSAQAPAEIGALAVLASVVGLYLAVRTWVILKGHHPHLSQAWPYFDVGFVTLALWLINDPTDPIFVVYLIPLASAIASLKTIHVAGIVTLTAIGYLTVAVFSGVPWTLGLFFRLVIVGVLASLYGWLIRTLTSFAREAERAEFQGALAREIHDGIQHLLVTMGARLDLAHRLVREAPQRAAVIIAEERETTRRAADELRYLVRRLRTAGNPRDLASALQLQVAGTADRWPFALHLEMPSQLPRIDPAVEHTILRLIQESMTNVAKHAQATEVTIRIREDDSLLTCTIQDNGHGFDPVAVSGSGLQGLHERTTATGGTFEIRSAPGQGTTIVATFPLQEAAQRTRFAS